jgi:hypothetical protein
MDNFGINSITNKINSDINNELEQLFLDGLKLKGYEFKDLDNPMNRLKLIEFVQRYCCKIVNISGTREAYTVKGEPFLIHFKTEMKIETIKEINGSIKISCDLGYYTFV